MNQGRQIDVQIRRFASSDRDWLVERHQEFYARDEGFDGTFGALVGAVLDDFMAAHDHRCDAGWIATRAAQRLGSIFCVRHDTTTAKLRLFLLVPEARGLGLGRRLLSRCTDFAQGSGYDGMTLWTHESHRAACALYARNGWILRRSTPVTSFGVDLVEQHWTLAF